MVLQMARPAQNPGSGIFGTGKARERRVASGALGC